MPSAHRNLTQEDVCRYVTQECFSTASGRVGAEIEWITVPATDPRAAVPFDLVQDAVAGLGSLPGGSLITFEPGGQIELSSIPGETSGEVCERLDRDEHALRAALEKHGIALTGIGLDPIRRDNRVLHLPRYAAMEHYFDTAGPEGRRMMCRTAAVQVSLDSGTGEAAAERWTRMHTIGPMIAAMFANSPFLEGRATGWRSTRLATWWAMDRTRTAPARSGDPVGSWTRYLLDARVMFVRVREDWYEPMSQPMTFRRWMEDGHDQGFPTLDDLAYHTTTVFPPVRPHGWLEMRMIDALPAPWWRVAVAVTAALLEDAEAGARAEEACRQTSRMWVTASRCGLEDPSLASAARTSIAAAIEALPRTGADAVTQEAAFSFADRFTFRGRCPADDLLDTWAANGRLPNEEESMEPAWT